MCGCCASSPPSWTSSTATSRRRSAGPTSAGSKSSPRRRAWYEPLARPALPSDRHRLAARLRSGAPLGPEASGTACGPAGGAAGHRAGALPEGSRPTSGSNRRCPPAGERWMTREELRWASSADRPSGLALATAAFLVGCGGGGSGGGSADRRGRHRSGSMMECLGGADQRRAGGPVLGRPPDQPGRRAGALRHRKSPRTGRPPPWPSTLTIPRPTTAAGTAPLSPLPSSLGHGLRLRLCRRCSLHDSPCGRGDSQRRRDNLALVRHSR